LAPVNNKAASTDFTLSFFFAQIQVLSAMQGERKIAALTSVEQINPKTGTTREHIHTPSKHQHNSQVEKQYESNTAPASCPHRMGLGTYILPLCDQIPGPARNHEAAILLCNAIIATH
jgi:hypothetical protein